MAYLTENELKELGLKSYGKDVLISTRAVLYGVKNITIGDNVRIDDFSLLSAVGGYIDIHNHIHIAAYASIFGRGGVTLEDFSGISSYVSIYSANDDYGGDYLVGPTMDHDLINVKLAPVTIGKYCTCGTHSTLMPGVKMNEGSILGANSFASKDLDDWGIYSGVPAKFLKARKKGLLEKAATMNDRWASKV